MGPCPCPCRAENANGAALLPPRTGARGLPRGDPIISESRRRESGHGHVYGGTPTGRTHGGRVTVELPVGQRGTRSNANNVAPARRVTDARVSHLQTARITHLGANLRPAQPTGVTPSLVTTCAKAGEGARGDAPIDRKEPVSTCMAEPLARASGDGVHHTGEADAPDAPDAPDARVS